MKYCDIAYTYDGKPYRVTERRTDYKSEKDYFCGILNRIESITDAGGTINWIDRYGESQEL